MRMPCSRLRRNRTFFLKAQLSRKKPETQAELDEGRQHGDHISPSEGSMEKIKTGRDAVAQKRIGDPRVGQDAVIRGKGLLPGQRRDESQMHLHIAVGALPGVERTVHSAESMGDEKKDPQSEKRRQQPYERPVFLGEACSGLLPGRAFCEEKPRREKGTRRSGRRVCRNGEPPQERKGHGGPHGKDRSRRAAQPEPDKKRTGTEKPKADRAAKRLPEQKPKNTRHDANLSGPKTSVLLIIPVTNIITENSVFAISGAL